MADQCTWSVFSSLVITGGFRSLPCTLWYEFTKYIIRCAHESCQIWDILVNGIVMRCVCVLWLFSECLERCSQCKLVQQKWGRREEPSDMFNKSLLNTGSCTSTQGFTWSSHRIRSSRFGNGFHTQPKILNCSQLSAVAEGCTCFQAN